MNINKRGLIVAVSSPSGGGKTTIIKKILKKDGPFIYSVSLTTREKRLGDVEGRDYWFVDQDTFVGKIKSGEFLEYEKVHGNYYGTPVKPIKQWLTKGLIILLDIDVHGAFSVRNQFPNDSLLVFLKPPSIKELEKRLTGRDTESQEQVQTRLERVPEEMELAKDFDHIVVNDSIDTTVDNILQIIKSRQNI